MARPGLSRLRRREGKRASESNIMIPMSVLDMFKISHQITSLPPLSSEVIHSGDQYICPVPACGLSFARKETAFEHLQSHEHRTQLCTPAPLIDAHMKHFWPDDATWREGSQFEASEPLAEDLPCPIDGCGKVLMKGRLEAHMRIFHPTMKYYKLIGELYSVPPMAPVTSLALPLKWCPKHVISSARCAVCLEIERQKGPKPPYTFYETLEIDFSAKRKLEVEGQRQRRLRTGSQKGTRSALKDIYIYACINMCICVI
jgi:hypothetical protein